MSEQKKERGGWMKVAGPICTVFSMAARNAGYQSPTDFVGDKVEEAKMHVSLADKDSFLLQIK